MTKEMTIQSVAQEMLDNLEWKKRRPEDENEVCVPKSFGGWQQEIIHKAHGDRLPDDYIYAFIWEALEALAGSSEGNEQEAIDEIEPDVYTSDLTAWLHSRNDNVYYLEEAKKEFGTIKSGFDLLSMAQWLAKQEVVQSILSSIEERVRQEGGEEDVD